MNNKSKKSCNCDYIWRLLILDTSGMYTQIYDEIYGNEPERLKKLYDRYSSSENFMYIIIEG